MVVVAIIATVPCIVKNAVLKWVVVWPYIIVAVLDLFALNVLKIPTLNIMVTSLNLVIIN